VSAQAHGLFSGVHATPEMAGTPPTPLAGGTVAAVARSPFGIALVTGTHLVTTAATRATNPIEFMRVGAVFPKCLWHTCGCRTTVATFTAAVTGSAVATKTNPIAKGSPRSQAFTAALRRPNCNFEREIRRECLVTLIGSVCGPI
jgi:hypothetical protein